MIYLIRGPFPGKGGRKYVIAEHDGKRKKMNYAKFVLLKDGVDVGRFEEVHHKNGNHEDDSRENLEKLKEYKHRQADRRIRYAQT